MDIAKARASHVFTGVCHYANKAEWRKKREVLRILKKDAWRNSCGRAKNGTRIFPEGLHSILELSVIINVL